LIPTFADWACPDDSVDNAERFHTFSFGPSIISQLFSMAWPVEGTDIYHQYVDDETYVDESLVNL